MNDHIDAMLDRIAATLIALAEAMAAVKAVAVPQPTNRVLTVGEVAGLLHVSERSVARVIDAGDLVGRRLLDGTVVTLADFNNYLRTLKVRNPRRVRRARARRALSAESNEV